MTQKIERKFAKFIDLKTIDQGPGGFEGHASIAGNLDDGGDIILDGSFNQVIDDFLRSGFTAHSHEWDIKDGVIGYPMQAYEDENGLFVSMKFHSTDDAQKVRTKMRERIEDGKEVGLSIGYRPKKPTYIYPKDFEKELPKYLKPEYLQEGLTKAKQFKYVRVIPEMSELKEFSVVTSPMNTASQVINVKDTIDDVEEKLGARNSSTDRTTMQEIHDRIVKLEPSVCSARTDDDEEELNVSGGDSATVSLKDIFSEEMAKRAEPKPYQIWDAFSTALCRIKKLKRSGVDSVLNTASLLDEAVTAMTDQLRTSVQAELDTERSDAEMQMSFYGHERPAEVKTDQPPPLDPKPDEELEVKDELDSPAPDVEEPIEVNDEVSHKAAHDSQRFRFEKYKTNALRQRAGRPVISV